MSGLFGDYFVVPTATAIVRAWELAGDHVRHYQVLRRHALKLAYWPASAPSAIDLDWDWVKGLDRVGELRIDEPIAGHRNVRVIFFKANLVLANDPIGPAGERMQRIWLLTVFAKKTQGFSARELKAWNAMKELIRFRHYGRTQGA